MSDSIADPELRALIQRCEAEAAVGRTGTRHVRAYLRAQADAGRHAPVIAGDQATFLYVGRPNTHVHVALAGEWNGWDHAAWMTPAGRSGLFWRSEHFNPAARLEYHFRVNGRIKADALNPRRG